MSISKNKIEKVCRQVLNERESLFIDLHLLQKLDLSYNRISTISKLCLLQNVLLQYLNVSHNMITYISRRAFSLTIDLAILDISFNHIKSFDTDVYSGSLLYINIRNNPVQYVIADPSFVMQTLVSESGKFCCVLEVRACLTSDGSPPSCPPRRRHPPKRRSDREPGKRPRRRPRPPGRRPRRR